MAWIYKRQGSDNWWVGWRSNGRQFLKSTRSANKAEAQKQCSEIESLHSWHAQGKLTKTFVEALTGKKAPVVSLRKALDEWLTEAKGATAPSTSKKYGDVSEKFATFIGANPNGPALMDIDTETVREFLVKRREQTTASTTNQVRKVLSIFFGRAVKNGQIQINPIAAVRPFKAGSGERNNRRAFTLAKLSAIFEKAPDDFWRYMVMGGFYTGLRLGDLASLRWGSVDFASNGLRLSTRKTDTRVFIPLRKPFREMLEDLAKLPEKTAPMDYLWPKQGAAYDAHGPGSFSQKFYEILAACGLVTPRKGKVKTKGGRDVTRAYGVSFHCLRHTFVSALALADGSKDTAKALAGHSSEIMSDHYTHVAPATLRAAIEKLPDAFSKAKAAPKIATGANADPPRQSSQRRDHGKRMPKR